MSRNSFTSTVRAIARHAARAERARLQEQARHEAAQRRAVAQATRQAKADAKEAARLYQAAQLSEAEALTNEIRGREQEIETLLIRALGKNPTINLNSLRKSFEARHFDETAWTRSVPREAHYAVERPGFFSRLLPGANRRYEQKIALAKMKFVSAVESYNQTQAARDAALVAFRKDEEERKAQIDRENAAVSELERGLAAGEHGAVLSYFTMVLARRREGDADILSAEIGYSLDSKHLVVDIELPDISAVPEEIGFKYVKSADRIDPIPRPIAKRKALYADLICKAALKSVDTIFRSSPKGIVECLTVNGMMDTIDPATGNQVRLCLLSVRVTAEIFRTLNLAHVQPEQCLRSLKASVSRAPDELLPVKPLIELGMVDPRFVETMDVMSALDERPNLMELTPTEFEGLITNLFATMGLDTRPTRPSRDGGVDCVAFDPRPVFGGKVVIQAKRYKNTVGVSAVRDLFGTVQNEGASKGILVTTSGYGKAAFDFAKGKPLELLDGANLLYMLAEHAKIEARIVMPDGWVDLPIHGE